MAEEAEKAEDEGVLASEVVVGRGGEGGDGGSVDPAAKVEGG